MADQFIENRNEFTVFKYPSQSLDLNPIEQLWNDVRKGDSNPVNTASESRRIVQCHCIRWMQIPKGNSNTETVIRTLKHFPTDKYQDLE